jgi:Baculovirus FP protein
MTPIPCITCSKNITDIRSPGVSCCECAKIFHIKCVSIDKNKFAVDSKKPGFKWTCRECQQKSTARRSQIFPAVALTRNSITPSVIQPSTSAQADFHQQLQGLIAVLAAVSQEFADYKSATDARIALLEAQQVQSAVSVTSLSATVHKVESKAEDLEQASTEKVLTIQGIPEHKLTDPLEVVSEIATVIGCQINPAEIDCKVSRSGTKPVLDIIFASKTARTAFLHAGKRFNREKKFFLVNDEQHKIFVNEKLTADQKKLLYDTKCFARLNNHRHVWFCNGNVHLKKDDNSTLFIVRTRQDFETLIRNDDHDNSAAEIIEARILLPERARSSVENERAASSNQSQ